MPTIDRQPPTTRSAIQIAAEIVRKDGRISRALAMEAARSLAAKDNKERNKNDGDGSDEAWKAVTLESIGVRGRLLKRLVAADILTLGDWSERNRQQYPRRIAGVGNAAIEKVGEFCEAYWEEQTDETDN